MEYRMEHDTMGQVAVPADKLWGAQTQRSLENFPIGEEKMPPDLIQAFAILKEACAAANHRLGKLDDRRFALIQGACLRPSWPGSWRGTFPWLSGRPAAAPRPT